MNGSTGRANNDCEKSPLRSATVVALTPLRVVHFTRDTIEELVEQVPSFGAAVRAAAAGRLDGS